MILFGAAVLAGITLFLWRSRRNYELLPELDSAPAALAGVTVIIPARNEAPRIARCIRSFHSPVIVVDDASSDDTAAIAHAAGARVVHAPPPAPGVLGKPNACAAGARAADSKWLLFVDADTWYEPDFAGRMVHYAESNSLDVLTVFLRQRRETWAEKIILPYAFALYFCGVNARRVNSADSSEALANGQCLLVRRDAYQRVGGHGAVAGSVIEDVAFAQVAKANNLRLRVLRAESHGNVRMYDSLAGIWRGLEKNSFRFLKANPWTGAQVIAASIALTSWLPAVLLSPRWLALAVAFAPAILLRRWYANWAEAATAPLGIYLFQLIALSGMLKNITGAKSTWKGRRV